jgi:hypothetical protein
MLFHSLGKNYENYSIYRLGCDLIESSRSKRIGFIYLCIYFCFHWMAMAEQASEIFCHCRKTVKKFSKRIVLPELWQRAIRLLVDVQSTVRFPTGTRGLSLRRSQLIPPMESTQSPIRSIPMASSLKVKRPGHEADQTDAAVKND